MSKKATLPRTSTDVGRSGHHSEKEPGLHRAQTQKMNPEHSSKLSADNAGSSASAAAAAAAKTSPPPVSGVPGTDDFDIYLFLNEEKRELLRDPVLQQMTVVRYEGEIDHGTGFFHGYGKMVSTLGYTYSGTFSKGLMHGQGRIAWSDGTTYEGEFVDNTISGNGKYTWPNGDWYDGDVRLHVRHGQGRFYYKALDETYDGEWNEGLRHGKGTLKYDAEGNTEYTGEWINDRRRGHGVMRYADGGDYEGEWRDDVRHGQGQMRWRQNGVVVEEYRGAWVHGTPSGQGVSLYIRPPQQSNAPSAGAGTLSPQTSLAPSASAAPGSDAGAPSSDVALNTYSGEYLEGKRHGVGTFVYDDGSRYEGQWQHNLKHGQGKFTSATGVVYVGQFVEGNPATTISDVKPETTVAAPVPLYIRDVLAQTETNESEAIIAVQSVISRNHGQLRKVFKYYSQLETGVDVITTPQDWRASRAQGTMYLLQFLRMCNDCKLITQHLTIVEIDRVLLAFKDRSESTTASAYLAANDNGPTSPTDSPKMMTPSPHAQSGKGAQAAAAAEQPAVDADGQSPTNLVDPKDPNRKASNASSGGRRSTSGSTVAGGGGGESLKYAKPWERYRNELHQFVGELNFREFVEAVVRVAAALYRDPVYGSLASKVQLVLDEHIQPFACQSATGHPLCRLCRENRSVLVKYIDPLKHCFDFYARASAMGSTAFGVGSAGSGTIATTSGMRVQDVTMTVRQLALMLKKCGLLGGADATPMVRLADVHKVLPFERHESFSQQVFRKAFVKHYINQQLQQQRQHQASASLTGAAATGGPVPPSPSAASGSNVPRPPPSATPSHAPSVAPDRQSVVSGQSNQLLPPNPNMLSTIHSATNSVDRQSVRDEEAHAAAVAEAEAALANRLAMQAKSRGAAGRSFRTTVAMDIELTFVEFVEALTAIAIRSFKENAPSQRVSSLMLNYVLPHEKDLPPLAA